MIQWYLHLVHQICIKSSSLIKLFFCSIISRQVGVFEISEISCDYRHTDRLVIYAVVFNNSWNALGFSPLFLVALYILTQKVSPPFQTLAINVVFVCFIPFCVFYSNCQEDIFSCDEQLKKWHRQSVHVFVLVFVCPLIGI